MTLSGGELHAYRLPLGRIEHIHKFTGSSTGSGSGSARRDVAKYQQVQGVSFNYQQVQRFRTEPETGEPMRFKQVRTGLEVRGWTEPVGVPGSL